MIEECPMRHENGNCLPFGGFCTAVREITCEALQNAYQMGYMDMGSRAKAEDFVQVVRCKDCKKRKTLPNWINGQPIDTYYCERFCDSGIGKVKLNDYCSYGERKESK